MPIEQLDKASPVRQPGQIVKLRQPPQLELVFPRPRHVDQRQHDALHTPAAVNGGRSHRHPPSARGVPEPDDQIAPHRAAAQGHHRRLRFKRQRRTVLSQELQTELARAPALQLARAAIQQLLGRRIARHDPRLLVQDDDAMLERHHHVLPVHAPRSWVFCSRHHITLIGGSSVATERPCAPIFESVPLRQAGVGPFRRTRLSFRDGLLLDLLIVRWEPRTGEACPVRAQSCVLVVDGR
jgi:hypothetical protein